jgi:hypothetical protein
LGVEGARWDVERVHGENDSMSFLCIEQHFLVHG